MAPATAKLAPSASVNFPPKEVLLTVLVTSEILPANIAKSPYTSILPVKSALPTGLFMLML